jgi:alpha-mannosidase
VAIRATYEWPIAAEGDETACLRRTARTMTAEIRTAVSLVAGDPVVEVETTFDNRVRDHRLRVHFPLPGPVTGSDAGCAFAVVHRGLEVEGGLAETPPPTFPARRFVDCSSDAAGLTVLADGTFEYEVDDGGLGLAVTLLRATGWLSRRRLATRPDPAGPAVPVEGAQVPGPRRWRYGLLLHAGNWERAHVSRRADAFLNPLEAVVGSGAAPASRPPVGRGLRVDGAEVSAVIGDGEGVAIRLFNPGSEVIAANVGDENVLLGPGEIATVRVGRRPAAGSAPGPGRG